MQRLLCLGYGYTAGAFARRLLRDGWRVAGTTRDAAKAAAMAARGVEPLSWRNVVDPGKLEDVAVILVSTPPGEHGCPALRAAEAAFASHKGIEWIGYLSTNGVYGDHGGDWVDETSELRATSPRALKRIAAENAWRSFARNHDLPLIVFRLPGIYGPGRSALDNVRAGTARRVVKPGQVFSRMHVEDIASVLAASMGKPRAFDLYNLADDEPAPPQDVVAYACELLGVEAPPEVAFEDADLSGMAKSFYADNKRVSNQRMKDALDVKLAYPTYREGLRAILAAEA
ncbi:MAG: SDR family oxidoreductase [Parvularculaceae bacterium]